MSQRLLIGLVFVLAIANTLLLWDINTKGATASAGMPSYLTILEDDDTADLRGMYAYPKLGKYTFPLDSTVVERPSLSLQVYFSLNSIFPMWQGELETLKRLSPVFKARGQRIGVAVKAEDSIQIAHIFDSADLHIPIMTTDSLYEVATLEQVGISDRAMPFRILYDSTMTAVYMRGVDNSPESRAEFERTMFQLSELYAERSSVRTQQTRTEGVKR